jgi:hypothetical protein
MYNRGARNLANGDVAWDSSDIRCLLVTSTYSPNKDHNTVSQITNELNGGNYVRKTLANKTVTQVDASDRVVLDADDIPWTALGAAAGTPKYAIIYFEGGGTDATRELIGFIDLDNGSGIPAPNGGDYTVAWHSTNGMFYHQT